MVNNKLRNSLLEVGAILILLLRGGCVKSKNQVFFDILYKKDFISLLC